jgi:hypothetical protein
MTKQLELNKQIDAIKKKRTELQTKFARGGIDREEQAVLDALQKQIDQKIKALSFAAPAAPPVPAAPGKQAAAPTDASTKKSVVPAGSPPPVPLAPPGEMHDEEVASNIVGKQYAILEGWESALQIFDKTMTSESDKEAKPDFQGVVLKHFRDKAVGELLKKVPYATEIKALADVIDAEIQRAGKAQASATLRDFVIQHAKDIGKLKQKLLMQREGFIAAVRKRREAAGVDVGPPGAPKPGNKKPVGKVEVNPKSLEEWTNMRLVLMDTLDALDKSLADATPEKLMRVLSEAWIRQGTTGKLAGQPIAAVVIIRLNPNLSVKNAHIQASGGQKLAEQLLKDSPDGVDVFGLNARRRILHYGDNDWPQATLELDENNKDLTAPADQTPKYTALKKHVLSKGLPPTKKITGD